VQEARGDVVADRPLLRAAGREIAVHFRAPLRRAQRGPRAVDALGVDVEPRAFGAIRVQVADQQPMVLLDRGRRGVVRQPEHAVRVVVVGQQHVLDVEARRLRQVARPDAGRFAARGERRVVAARGAEQHRHAVGQRTGADALDFPRCPVQRQCELDGIQLELHAVVSFFCSGP
jgi:hypothetical protein